MSVNFHQFMFIGKKVTSTESAVNTSRAKIVNIFPIKHALTGKYDLSFPKNSSFGISNILTIDKTSPLSENLQDEVVKLVYICMKDTYNTYYKKLQNM